MGFYQRVLLLEYSMPLSEYLKLNINPNLNVSTKSDMKNQKELLLFNANFADKLKCHFQFPQQFIVSVKHSTVEFS